MVPFKTFLSYYIRYQMERHPNNKYWETAEQVIDNLGGLEQIDGTYNLWLEASSDAQRRVCGWSSSDIEYNEHALSTELSTE